MYLRVYWCWDGYLVTSWRIDAVYPETDGLCSVNWGPEAWREGGGNGYTSVDVQARMVAQCQFGGTTLNETIWLVVRYGGDGSYAIVGSS